MSKLLSKSLFDFSRTLQKHASSYAVINRSLIVNRQGHPFIRFLMNKVIKRNYKQRNLYRMENTLILQKNVNFRSEFSINCYV